MADSYSTIRQSYIERGGEYSFIPSGVCRTIAHVNNIPTMQFFTGISRNTQSKSDMLSLTECVWEFRNNALWDTL